MAELAARRTRALATREEGKAARSALGPVGVGEDGTDAAAAASLFSERLLLQVRARIIFE